MSICEHHDTDFRALPVICHSVATAKALLPHSSSQKSLRVSVSYTRLTDVRPGCQAELVAIVRDPLIHIAPRVLGLSWQGGEP